MFVRIQRVEIIKFLETVLLQYEYKQLNAKLI